MGQLKCDKGYKGDCCCNCKYYYEITKHPWNKGGAKGSITDSFGWVCTVFYEMDKKYRKFMYSDRGHGACEMYMDKTSDPVNF